MNLDNKSQANTLTNILAELDLALLGVQNTDMDLRSLENSSVNSFFISCLITYTQTRTLSSDVTVPNALSE